MMYHDNYFSNTIIIEYRLPLFREEMDDPWVYGRAVLKLWHGLLEECCHTRLMHVFARKPHPLQQYQLKSQYQRDVSRCVFWTCIIYLIQGNPPYLRLGTRTLLHKCVVASLKMHGLSLNKKQ